MKKTADVKEGYHNATHEPYPNQDVEQGMWSHQEPVTTSFSQQQPVITRRTLTETQSGSSRRKGCRGTEEGRKGEEEDRNPQPVHGGTPQKDECTGGGR